MQTPTNTNKTVHIKAQHNDEFRRFSLSSLTFASLESTLQTVFGFPLETVFRIKFLDDEKDWILFSSDFEFQHAIELSTSPLRILLVLPGDTPVKGQSQDVKPLLPEEPDHRWEAKWRGRGGRGCGRGGMTRGGPMIRKEERQAMKTARISGLISALEATLLDPTLTSDRERAITWKIDRLRQKLERFETVKPTTTGSEEREVEMKEADCPEEVKQVPASDPADVDEKPWSRGRGRCGRGRGRQERTTVPTTEEEGDHPCGKKWLVPKETWAHFQECKGNLVVARRSGDAEAIKVAFEAFMLAKEQKKATRYAKNF